MKKVNQVFVFVFAYIVFGLNASADENVNELSVLVEAYSGRPNPGYSLNIDSEDSLAATVKGLLYDVEVGALVPEGDYKKISNTNNSYGGIVISDAQGGNLEPSVTIIVKVNSITVKKDSSRTVYSNSYPKLYKLLVKRAYKLGLLDRRSALNLYERK